MAEIDQGANGNGGDIEATGGSVEEAVKRALLRLNATLDEVDIEVIDGGGGGFRLLPGGGRPAKVRVTRRDRPYSEEPEDVGDGEPQVEQETRDSEQGSREEVEAVLATPAAELGTTASISSDEARRSDVPLESGDELAEVANDVITELLERMGFVASIEQISDDPLTFNVVGEDDLSHLIGERGETLRTFGYLVNVMVGRRMALPCRVTLDVDRYRERRALELDELAQTLSDQVRETQEPVTLQAMPPRERRLIHVALADDAYVRTYSIGEDDDRRVVISPKA